MKTKAIRLTILTILIFSFALIYTQIGLGKESVKFTKTELNDYFEDILNSTGLVGISAVLTDKDTILWEGYFGKSNVEDDIPVTSETVFMLASSSKVFTGAAILKLYDEGLIKLDDDINYYIPFKLRNPHHPRRPITFRMLLTHTSSIADNRSIITKLYVTGDSKISLSEFIEGYLQPGGKYYSDTNFLKSTPGSEYKYGNIPFALIGYIVEKISGTSFDQYCKEKIFKPLEMNNTGWFLSSFKLDEVAINYRAKTRESDEIIAVPHYGWAGYPDGQLRSSARQVANYLMFLLNRNYKDASIFKQSTLDEIFKIQLPNVKSLLFGTIDYGLVWQIAKMNERIAYLHTGRGSGITTIVMMFPKTDTGLVLFITGQINSPKIFLNILEKMLKYADYSKTAS